MRTVEAAILLKKGMRFLPDLVDAHCGNSEGTPCDDRKPSYVCPQHKWLKKVRKALGQEPLR